MLTITYVLCDGIYVTHRFACLTFEPFKLSPHCILNCFSTNCDSCLILRHGRYYSTIGKRRTSHVYIMMLIVTSFSVTRLIFLKFWVKIENKIKRVIHKPSGQNFGFFDLPLVVTFTLCMSKLYCSGRVNLFNK